MICDLHEIKYLMIIRYDLAGKRWSLLRKIAQTFPKLECLILEECSGFTVEDLEMMLDTVGFNLSILTVLEKNSPDRAPSAKQMEHLRSRVTQLLWVQSNHLY